jgi:hypothetical protein
MAGGSYSQMPMPEPPAPLNIPPRATRQLQRVRNDEEWEEDEKATRLLPEVHRETEEVPEAYPVTGAPMYEIVGHRFSEGPPPRPHRPWLQLFTICMVVVVLGAIVLISAGIYQRTGGSYLVNFPGGQVYSIQVGGSIDNIDTWENTNAPIPPRVPIHPGPYSVLGKPTITPEFINEVLASYHSPAAGKGQALYDLGVKYGIDPAFALAFFLHESTMGTTGVARTTLSLGNLRCIPARPCVTTGGNGSFAQMYSWEDGFEQFYRLIRNLYVSKWGLVTVDQIIPVYAPSSDHNNVQGYIGSLKHYVDTWHAGIIRP